MNLSSISSTSSTTTTTGVIVYTTQIKSKSEEQKMGFNLPIILANSQPIDTWNTVGQFSPPMSERNHQLRVPLPMSFANSQSELHVAGSSSETARSLFGGSSGNSELAVSPQKPMDTSDIDDKEDAKQAISPSNCDRLIATDTSKASISGGGVGITGESDTSPLQNTNMHEAHQPRLRSQDMRNQNELDIKQELVDYFHAPHPPAPPDSHRSYGSTEEIRMSGSRCIGGRSSSRSGGDGGVAGGGCDSDDYAQDLRISAGSSKGIDFSHLVLPSARSLRQSTESLEEKYTPLNMRKLSSTVATTNPGQVLMNSLLSNESMSEGGTSASGQHDKSLSQDVASSSAAAAAAAAFYAETLNRDDCDFIGSNVTLKLRSMDRTQRIIAEKLISEVLYYGQFNELERSARIQPK